MADNKQPSSSGGFQDDVLSISSSSRPDFLSIFNHETNYPIFRTFCDCLSIAEIFSLTRTCKSLAGLYRYLLPVDWDVDKALRGYFDDPLGFRSQMAKCDAFIYGGFAAQYFERVSWKSQPLEIAVAQGRKSELFSNYVLDVAGYADMEIRKFSENEVTFYARNFAPIILANSFACAFPYFQKKCRQWILFRTKTTAGLSIISWNKAYCLFALPTCIQHKNYLLHPPEKEDTQEEARLYSEKGWHVQDVTFPEEERFNHPIQRRRHIGDRYTWTIPLDAKKVEYSTTPDYVLEHIYFRIHLPGSETRRPWRECYPIRLRSFTSKVLKHTYSYGEGVMREFLKARLHPYIISELRKLDPAQRPTNYDELLSNCDDIHKALEGFDPPAGWTYCDDEIPTWCKEFEEIYPELL